MKQILSIFMIFLVENVVYIDNKFAIKCKKKKKTWIIIPKEDLPLVLVSQTSVNFYVLCYGYEGSLF